MTHETQVRACLITNPRGGRGDLDLSPAIRVLESHGWDVAVQRKLHGGHATTLAREAVGQGYTVIVDCGGDGTLSEIVEGAMGSDVAVGVLPGGTANLWAHETGIAARFELAAMQLVGAERRRIDVGQVSVNGRHQRHFLLMAGLGFDAAVLAHLSKPLKLRIGRLAYLPAIVRAAQTFHDIPVTMEMDGLRWSGHVRQVILGNTRRYASFTQITPGAFVDDGLLDVTMIGAQGPLQMSRQLGALLFRQRPSAATSLSFRAAEVRITTPMLAPLQLDGGYHSAHHEDVAHRAEYSFSVMSRAVSMLIPRTYDGTLFAPAQRVFTAVDFPLQPLELHPHSTEPRQPADDAAPGASDGGDLHAPAAHDADAQQDAPSSAKKKQWDIRVLGVEIHTLSAVRLQNGRVHQIAIDERTLFAREDGTRPLLGAMSAISEGDLLQVEGYKIPDDGGFLARRISPLAKSLQAKRANRRHKARRQPADRVKAKAG
jgi:YegS/Rv2252/BmrU family lipid kinase